MLPPEIVTMGTRLKEVEGKVRMLEMRPEDAKNRSHRNNIRLIGIPENTEKGRMLDFLENWLRE